MKLIYYIKTLQDFIKDSPGSDQTEVCYVTNDEGNMFGENIIPPILMYRDGVDYEYVDEAIDATHVCIN